MCLLKFHRLLLEKGAGCYLYICQTLKLYIELIGHADMCLNQSRLRGYLYLIRLDDI